MNNISDKNNIYVSGLNDADWRSLRDILCPFIHAKNPSEIMSLLVGIFLLQSDFFKLKNL